MPVPTTVLDGITLPGDLIWEDEFQWVPVERASEYSLTGALIANEAVMLEGRPITLVAKNEFLGPIWLSRSIIKELYDKSALLDHEMTLTLSDGRSFTVVFRENGVTADSVYHIGDHLDEDRYYLKLQLQTV